VRLRVRILNWLVFSLRTTVRAIRDSLREISVSANGTSCSKVSSTDIDLVSLSGTTSLRSTPREKSYKRVSSGGLTSRSPDSTDATVGSREFLRFFNLA
jgi:hypothetical protein